MSIRTAFERTVAIPGLIFSPHMSRHARRGEAVVHVDRLLILRVFLFGRRFLPATGQPVYG